VIAALGLVGAVLTQIVVPETGACRRGTCGKDMVALVFGGQIVMSGTIQWNLKNFPGVEIPNVKRL
jgi:hypothetical protein